MGFKYQLGKCCGCEKEEPKKVCESQNCVPIITDRSYLNSIETSYPCELTVFSELTTGTTYTFGDNYYPEVLQNYFYKTTLDDSFKYTVQANEKIATYITSESEYDRTCQFVYKKQISHLHGGDNISSLENEPGYWKVWKQKGKSPTGKNSFTYDKSKFFTFDETKRAYNNESNIIVPCVHYTTKENDPTFPKFNLINGGKGERRKKETSLNIQAHLELVEGENLIDPDTFQVNRIKYVVDSVTASCQKINLGNVFDSFDKDCFHACFDLLDVKYLDISWEAFRHKIYGSRYVTRSHIRTDKLTLELNERIVVVGSLYEYDESIQTMNRIENYGQSSNINFSTFEATAKYAIVAELDVTIDVPEKQWYANDTSPQNPNIKLTSVNYNFNNADETEFEYKIEKEVLTPLQSVAVYLNHNAFEATLADNLILNPVDDVKITLKYANRNAVFDFSSAIECVVKRLNRNVYLNGGNGIDVATTVNINFDEDKINQSGEQGLHYDALRHNGRVYFKTPNLTNQQYVRFDVYHNNGNQSHIFQTDEEYDLKARIIDEEDDRSALTKFIMLGSFPIRLFAEESLFDQSIQNGLKEVIPALNNDIKEGAFNSQASFILPATIRFYALQKYSYLPNDHYLRKNGDGKIIEVPFGEIPQDNPPADPEG